MTAARPVHREALTQQTSCDAKPDTTGYAKPDNTGSTIEVGAKRPGPALAAATSARARGEAAKHWVARPTSAAASAAAGGATTPPRAYKAHNAHRTQAMMRIS